MPSRRLVVTSLVSVLTLLTLVTWSVPARAQTQGGVAMTALPHAGPAPLTVSFSATVYGASMVALDWDFGDGSKHGTAFQETHVYTDAGTYTVFLTATESYSGILIGTATTDITVWEPVSVTARQAPDAGPAPLTVNFTGQAEGGFPPYRFQWDFGDGSPGTTEQNPVHTYTTPGAQHPVLKAWDRTGAEASDTRLVTAVTPQGTLQGRVVISSEGSFYLLNGPGITSAIVTAKDTSTGAKTQANVVRGVYQFDSLPNGAYELTVALTYTDHIPYDADLLTFGCPAPSAGTVLKQVTSTPVSVTVSGAPLTRDLTFPPPLVFVHGALNCYQKWYDPSQDPAFTALWDNDARTNGFISFTPNYQWWVSQATWPQRADEVFTELDADLAGLSSLAAPAVMVAHDMGGLVARVLTGGSHRNDSLVRRIRRLYLMGTPNSGSDFLLAGGWADYLGTAEIVRRFNEVYPSFGATEVYAMGGSRGPWGLGNFDGRVSLYSAFTIAFQTCSQDAYGFPVCKTFSSQVFDSGAGHIFPYSHYDLGSPASTGAILEGTILPWVLNLSSAQVALAGLDGPKSPVSGTIWGTTARTSSSGSQGVPPGLAPETSPLELPFDVSKTDGVFIYGQVWAGSADFQVTGPGGQSPAGGAVTRTESGDPGFSYNLVAPVPGTYTLHVTPGAEGAYFSYTVAEDSLFGITGYLTQTTYVPGGTALLRLDFDGLTPDVLPTGAEAAILDASGALLTTVPLYDDGQHQDGQAGDGFYGNTTQAPLIRGRYFVVFRAQGTDQGVPFTRTDLARLYVVPPDHLFTGAFSDAPADMDPAGLYTALDFVAGLRLQAGEAVVVSADLYDKMGRFISHAASQAKGFGLGSVAVTLTFPLAGVHCSQFGGPFLVRNLAAADAFTLIPLDPWDAPVSTSTYSSAGFECLPGGAQPSLLASRPDAGVPGQRMMVSISGIGFKPGAWVTGGQDVTFTDIKWISENLLQAVAAISFSAAPGPRALTVQNTDGTSATTTDVFSIVAVEPPYVAILAPEDGGAVGGTVDVVATATDQVQVEGVSFLLDGVQKATLTTVPFTWTLDSADLASGAHTITARATGSSGLTADASISVTKDTLAITSIQKGGSPFKLKIAGVNFQPGSSVFIGSDTAPWSSAVVKGDRLIVLKGGAALKTKFPSGVGVPVRVQNPNGASATATYTRP